MVCGQKKFGDHCFHCWQSFLKNRCNRIHQKPFNNKCETQTPPLSRNHTETHLKNHNVPRLRDESLLERTTNNFRNVGKRARKHGTMTQNTDSTASDVFNPTTSATLCLLFLADYLINCCKSSVICKVKLHNNYASYPRSRKGETKSSVGMMKQCVRTMKSGEEVTTR